MPKALSPARIAAFEGLAIELAQAAAAAALPLFRGDHGIENKAAGAEAFDPVTAADRSAEAAIRRLIAERCPHHGVIGEEYGEDRPEAEFVWVLDPVDGTRAFVAGLPLWTTLIALRWRGRPVVGLIAQPYLEEVFVGSAEGSRLLRKGEVSRLSVRPCPRLGEATIATTDPDLFTGAERGAWSDLRAATRLARYGCDAYAFAMVALGRVDLVVEAGLKAWDIEVAIPLLQGAGGHVTDWRGEPVGDQGGQAVLAGDRTCLEQALSALKTAAA